MSAFRAGLIALLLASAHAVAAMAEQSSGIVVVRARNGAAPIPSAEVSAEGAHAQTDERGEARLPLPAGTHTIAVSRVGFFPATLQVTVRAGTETTVTVQLWERRFEAKVVVVSATRSGTVVEDQPIRVEAVPQEEIEENLTIAPGNLTTLLNELGGLRLQESSSGLGGTSLRLQGLSGRYTQILLDELPLYGQQPDAFSLLQTPPLDLAQVEIIKGTRTALYGGTALGGLVNLVSRLPGSEPELLLSQTAHGGTDAVGFASRKRESGWGCTLLGGAHRQVRKDLDGDGWADLPGYRRTELRPRLFWTNRTGGSFFATVGATAEDRQGGTLEGATTPAGTPFGEELHTRRLDGGLVGRFVVRTDRLITMRASLAGTWHNRRFGEDRDRNLRSLALAEATVRGSDRGHTWVTGGALQRDAYQSRDHTDFDFAHVVPSLFAQDEYALAKHAGISASGRLDFDDQHGAFFAPLVSALVRPGARWTARLSAGAGYAAPVPFTEETEVVGLSHLLPLHNLQPERAKSAALDIGWSGRRLELNGTVFVSEVRDPLLLRVSAAQSGRLEIVNAPVPTRTVGSEFLARMKTGPLQVIATHTYLHSTESERTVAGRRDVPLTPRHAAELAAIWEKESRGRIGAELSYTGRQHLEDDPYRSTSVPYVELNSLAELRRGEASLFVNILNLTNVRQTRFDPLLLPARAPDGQWATEVWAPLEGRAFNAGVRLEF